MEWLEAQLEDLRWDAQTTAEAHVVELSEPVGYSQGELVTKIKIELSSSCVHAYPVKD